MKLLEITTNLPTPTPAPVLVTTSTTIRTKTMPVLTPNKHELRTRETRELLLQAAETVFIRDGYEGAELGDIANLAGRTKGAIYAQFKSKEDIFLALVETQALRRRALLRERLAGSFSVKENVAAMRRYVLESAVNDSWGLLLLEFRLFAIRHPDSQERLRQTYAAIVTAHEEERYTELLGPSPNEEDPITRTAAVHSMFAMLSALQLESRFAAQALAPDESVKVAAKIFDTLFPPPPDPS
jgi:AcrR family transcriptional regulator